MSCESVTVSIAIERHASNETKNVVAVYVPQAGCNEDEKDRCKTA